MLTYSEYETDTRVQQYAKALAERGDTVDVLALSTGEQPRHELIGGVNVYRIQRRERNERGPLSYLLKLLFFFCRSSVLMLRRHLARRYQLIHVHNVPDFLVFAALVPKLTGAATVLDIHDILPEFYASKFDKRPHSAMFRFLQLMERISTRFANYTIIANELWRQRITARSVAPEKCVTICNYPESRFFYPRERRRADRKFVIIYPGSLNWHQGVDVALRALAKISHQIPELEFQIYGEGPEKRNLIRLTQELRIDSRVVFRHFLPVQEIAEVMAEADLAIVPKRASSPFGNEADSTKILEFMTLGVPVIESRTRIGTYYHNDSIVRFFKSEDVDDLAAQIIALWKDESVRRQLVQSAREHARANNWEVKKDEYLRLVNSLQPCESSTRNSAKAESQQPQINAN